MSTDKQRTVKIGILPEQTEDYSQYEESELNWGRISAAGILALIVLAVLIYVLLGNNDNDVTSPSKTVVLPTINHNEIEKAPTPTPTKTVEKVTQESKKMLPVDLKKTNEAVSPQVSIPVKQAPSNTAKTDLPIAKTEQKIAASQQSHAQTHPTKIVTPVKILDPRIKKAQLSSKLIKGLPVDSLLSKVQMSQEGIIRVHLYTEMENLRGQDLYHHWYRNGEKQARVRIPVNHNHQRSSSSKFINKQMLGQWAVQVLDEQGKAYIEVNFEVVNP